MRVLAISGSLRRDSHNTALLRAAAEHAPTGVELMLWGGLKAIPPYSEDDDGDHAPATVTALRTAVAGADGILISTPEYNHSVPGALKNALDWLSRPLATNPLRNKPVAVIGASAGIFGAVWAQAELRKVLAATGARVVDRELAVGRADERIEAGVVGDAELSAELGDLVGELAEAVKQRERALLGTAADAGNGEPVVRAVA